MIEPEDVLWCDECGQGLPWRHDPKPTARRRLVEPLTRVLYALARPLTRTAQALYDWADKPHRATYAVKRVDQDKRFMARMEREKREGRRVS